MGEQNWKWMKIKGLKKNIKTKKKNEKKYHWVEKNAKFECNL